MEHIVFNQIELHRSRTLAIVAELSENQADVVPNGFNNNLRWHLGHILTTQERFAFLFIGAPLSLPQELMNLFLNGTKPADWQTAPPDLPSLLKLLEEQPSRIRERLQGRLAEQITIPFKDFNRLDEVLLFGTCHEAMHAGNMMALKKAVAAQM
ncbi:MULTISPECIES: DinB family protein [unclassified Paenibacillus]|uniref:DinB family protein n=1 Tax=unclassified Paenibacillus TaxID=185978 RepID=UPI001AE6759B|nr:MULTISPECIES: DinB family protein [unclassified Paenibacillus]MBP1154966.1 putative damage-inducible protein DinB [Paenibacillus sp. PvP091]MBP1169650.1 putative damage-inducible protein DinB [Paenibacillus sp. PvR098]MBP2440678.1 putative damage-inducible protein DinB [Paenibacillus sp. PvP052]